ERHRVSSSHHGALVPGHELPMPKWILANAILDFKTPHKFVSQDGFQARPCCPWKSSSSRMIIEHNGDSARHCSPSAMIRTGLEAHPTTARAGKFYSDLDAFFRASVWPATLSAAGGLAELLTPKGSAALLSADLIGEGAAPASRVTVPAT